MRRHFPLIAAAAAVLTGCGGSSQPHLARSDADGLIALSHRIAGEGPCAQSHDIPKLRAQAVALVNARRVPAALQESLISAVNALSAETPLCLPTVTAATTTTSEVATRTPAAPRRHAHPAPHPPTPPKPHPHPHPPAHGPGHGHGPGHK